MKRFTLFLFLLFCCTTSMFAQKNAATIELKVKDVVEGIVSVTLPVEHTVFWGATRIDTIKANKVHLVNVNEGQTGFVQIDVFGRSLKLYVQKGDRIRVSIDEENTILPVSIEGNNKEGQLLLCNSELPYTGNLITRYKNDTTAALLGKHIAEDKKVRLTVYKLLYEQRKIDKAFFDFIQLTLDYYHAALTSEVLLSRYTFTTLPKEHPQYKPTFPTDLSALWESTYKQYPVNNVAALQTFGYNDGFNTYAGNYINGYLSWFKDKHGTAWPPTNNWSTEMKETLQRIQNNLDTPVAEFIEAGILYSELTFEKNYTELVKLVAEFRKKYPRSIYTPYLLPLVNKAIAFNNKVKKDFTPEQKLIPDYASINSFGQLMMPFKGKTVYIEFWATWCITCKDQFEHEPTLNKFLKSKGVEHLFVSVDNEAETQEWKEMIKFYDLQGQHIKANPSLIKDLSKIFWNGKGYALPLYVIISPSGNIMEFDALRPADKKRLYQQIEKQVN